MPRTKKKRTKKSSTTKQSIDKMKYEIANEFGVNLGPNASSRDNGLVGGEMTKRLIENSMSRSTSNSSHSKRKRKTNKSQKKNSK